MVSEDGFTLLELLAVILIVGILAAIAVPTFLSQRTKAYAANAKSDLKNAESIVEAFASSSGGQYAPTSAATPSSTLTVQSVFDSGTAPFQDADAASLGGVQYADSSSSSNSADSYILAEQGQSAGNTYYLDVYRGTAYYGSTLGGVASSPPPAAGTNPGAIAGFSTSEAVGWAS